MNEFQSIRDLLTEAPPTAEARAAGLARLAAEPRGNVRILRPAWKPALGLTATAAAAAVAIAIVGHGSTAPPASPPDRAVATRTLGSTDVLLVAAERLEALPLGKYWSTDQIMTQSYVVRAKTGPYVITGATTETFQWKAVAEGGGDLLYGRELPAGPLTAADKAAWGKAGSPTSFRVWSNDHYITYRTGKAGPWEADVPQAGKGGRFPFTGFGKIGVPESCTVSPACDEKEGYGATVADLQAIDTDPQALLKRYTTVRNRGGVTSTNAQLLLRVSDDLANAPLPPQLQAGILRMIPSLPGVTRIDDITDPLGRKGFALAAERGGEHEAKQPYGARTELLFSLDGSYLGHRDVLTRPAGVYESQKPGFVINTWIVRSAGWTDTKPEPPAATAY